jgi:hypothetical protein
MKPVFFDDKFKRWKIKQKQTSPSINALRRSKYAACISTSLCPAPGTQRGST